MFASSIPLKLPVIIGTNLRIILSHNNRLSTTKIILKGSWKNLSVSTYLILCGRRYWTAVVIAFNEIFEPFYVCCENKHFFCIFRKIFFLGKKPVFEILQKYVLEPAKPGTLNIKQMNCFLYKLWKFQVRWVISTLGFMPSSSVRWKCILNDLRFGEALLQVTDVNAYIPKAVHGSGQCLGLQYRLLQN